MLFPPNKVKVSSTIQSPKFCKSIKDEKLQQWLVGFLDASGCFNIVKSRGTYKLQFNLDQPFYNLRVLYYIKNQLGYGKILKVSNKMGQIAHFRITDKEVLNYIIFPILEKYPLLTSKHFLYLQFKKAYLILENPNFTTKQKNEKIQKILNIKIPTDYVSPAISHLSETSNYEEIKSAVSDY